MLLSNSVLAVATVLVGQVLAKDTSTCYTTFTNKPPGYALQTKWSTHYTPCTTTLYSTVQKTFTPKVTETKTVHTYVTVTDKKKGASTTTKTATITNPETITTTSTATEKKTIDVKKSITESAPAHFTPIQQSLPGSSNSTTDGKERRSVEEIEKRNSPPAYGYGGKKYPKEVKCDKYTNDKHCVTKKVTKTKTITAYPYTVTIKTTKTGTSTLCPDAKKTVTATATETKHKTITKEKVVTTTITKKNIVGTTTVNAACVTKANYADAISGMPIVYIEPIPETRDFGAVQFQVEDSFACCNAAYSSRKYEEDPEFLKAHIFVFDRRVDPADSTKVIGQCTLIGGDVCQKQKDFLYLVENLDQASPLPEDGEDMPTIGDPIFGNAPCGLGVGPESKK